MSNQEIDGRIVCFVLEVFGLMGAFVLFVFVTVVGLSEVIR